ncbi:MAG: hypothetical protein HC846_11865 [Blastocatellia bacterium]|nr:hypothetical protein [Blastocatellia bacterium]
MTTIIAVILLTNCTFAQTQQRDFSKESARTSQEWVKDAVIYEIFPRQYSQKGDFNSITKDLDRLRDLGVTVLWIMPIHPIGKLKAKRHSRFAVCCSSIFTPSTPIMAQVMISNDLSPNRKNAE